MATEKHEYVKAMNSAFMRYSLLIGHKLHEKSGCLTALPPNVLVFEIFVTLSSNSSLLGSGSLKIAEQYWFCIIFSRALMLSW